MITIFYLLRCLGRSKNGMASLELFTLTKCLFADSVISYLLNVLS